MLKLIADKNADELSNSPKVEFINTRKSLSTKFVRRAVPEKVQFKVKSSSQNISAMLCETA